MANASSYIDSSQRIEGTVSAAEDLYLAGHVIGQIESSHALVIERDGIVEASVSARRVEVHGTVVGDLVAAEDVLVSSTGQVQGSITARRVAVEEGGRLDADVTSGDGARPAASRSTNRRSASRPSPRREARAEPKPEPEPEPVEESPTKAKKTPPKPRKKSRSGTKKTRKAPRQRIVEVVDEVGTEVVEIPEDASVEEPG